MPGATARVQTKVLVRFASTTACQSSSLTCSSGRPDLSDDAARVVDEDVDAADPLDELADLTRVADVDRVAVDAVHRRAVRLERCGDTAADAVRGARDERDAT